MASHTLKTTALNDLHRRLGAKMVPFAGYDMPVQYPMGILKEHLHTRQAAGLFDVSHMGQAWLISEEGTDPAIAVETVMPADLQGLDIGRQRYSQLLNAQGGIMDDLMITRPCAGFPSERLYLVVNAACKQADFQHLEAALAGRIRVQPLEDRALIALQGPKAAEVLVSVSGHPSLSTQPFMSQSQADWKGADLWLSRSGYTGEDGYEISLPASSATAFAEALLSHEAVEPVGLGARDSLRLEAGLCLYGHDIDTQTTPLEAGLGWSIGKRRRTHGGFPGADMIQSQLEKGVQRRRVGIQPEGRAPARAGTEILDPRGSTIGKITSGGFGPSIAGPVAMGYVDAAYSDVGTDITLSVRGKAQPAKITTLPFVKPGFYRG